VCFDDSGKVVRSRRPGCADERDWSIRPFRDPEGEERRGSFIGIRSQLQVTIGPCGKYQRRTPGTGRNHDVLNAALDHGGHQRGGTAQIGGGYV
jgi:hypothetical protein